MPSKNRSSTSMEEFLDECRRAMRHRHLSYHTEKSYLDWIEKFVRHFRRDKDRVAVLPRNLYQALSAHLELQKHLWLGQQAQRAIPPCSHAMRERRQRLGLLQREVAARAGLSPTTYCLIESGARTSIRRETLERIAVALECAPATLIEETIA